MLQTIHSLSSEKAHKCMLVVPRLNKVVDRGCILNHATRLHIQLSLWSPSWAILNKWDGGHIELGVCPLTFVTSSIIVCSEWNVKLKLIAFIFFPWTFCAYRDDWLQYIFRYILSRKGNSTVTQRRASSLCESCVRTRWLSITWRFLKTYHSLGSFWLREHSL